MIITNFINSQIGIKNGFKPSLLILIILIAFCCRNRQSGYVYHEKWVIPNIYDPNSLKGEPQEVKEIYYNNLDDTSFTSPGLSSSSELSRFDRSGNIILSRFYFSKTSMTDVSYSYGPAGPEHHIHSFDSLPAKETAKEAKAIPERIGPDKFKITSYYDTNYSRHHIVSFSENGEIVKDEKWMHDVFVGHVTSYYTGDKLMREETIQGKEKKEEIYYYSAKGFLDSIVVFENDKRSGSTIYLNNEHGDAVFYLQTDRDQVLKKLRVRYQYDENGNWIKQLTFTEIDNTILRMPVRGQKFPGYSLCIREIKY